MAKYSMIDLSDGNYMVPLESKDAEGAAIEALNMLGYSLSISPEDPEEE
jgi:hypothetical protein